MKTCRTTWPLWRSSRSSRLIQVRSHRLVWSRRTSGESSSSRPGSPRTTRFTWFMTRSMFTTETFYIGSWIHKWSSWIYCRCTVGHLYIGECARWCWWSTFGKHLNGWNHWSSLSTVHVVCHGSQSKGFQSRNSGKMTNTWTMENFVSNRNSFLVVRLSRRDYARRKNHTHALRLCTVDTRRISWKTVHDGQW